MHSMLLLIFIFINAFTLQTNNELSGVVKNKKGEVLSGVNIYFENSVARASNANGKFKLNTNPNKKNIIYFIKDGYKPIVQIIGYENDPLEIVMEEKSESAISSCQNRAGSNKIDIFDDNLQIFVSNKIDNKIKRNGRYSSYTIYFNSNDRSTFLSGSSGPGVTNGFPYESWILDSTELSIESIKYKNKKGEDKIILDLKGKFTNGKYWRYVNNFEAIIAEYHNVPNNISTHFDSIIDGLCSK